MVIINIYIKLIDKPSIYIYIKIKINIYMDALVKLLFQFNIFFKYNHRSKIDLTYKNFKIY